MDQSPQCKHFDAKRSEVSENCSNCTKWIGEPCLDHLQQLKRLETKQKLEAFDFDANESH